MRIRTQFTITLLLFTVMLAIIAGATIIVNQKAEKASEQEKIAGSIAQGATELNYLSDDYLVYRESQQLSRWQARFASFSSDIASLDVDKPEQQALVRSIRANQQRLKEVFDGIASALGGSSQGGDVDPAFLQVSWSRMTVQSQGLTSDALRLSQLLRAEVEQLTQMRDMLIYSMLIVFGTFLILGYVQIFRRTLKSISDLKAGTRTIGSGNLDFSIEEKKDDEFGELAHAFNQMTADLKTVTATKVDLEREITERRRAEAELQASRHFLEIANLHREITPLIQEFVREAKNLTNCAAVGIRLLDGSGNIPYTAYLGFSREFYEKESPLSIKTDNCMCINVVRGTTDPSLSFYTEYGSFYINGTTRFLATVSEEEKGKTRNVCNAVGYESVALIPIRSGTTIFGLIHLADYRENMFPLEMVKQLEQATPALGISIQRILAEEALRESEQRYATTLASIGDAVIATDVEGRITFMNAVAEGLTGWRLAEASAQPVHQAFRIINERTRKTVEDPVARVLSQGKIVGLANHTLLVRKDGTEIPIDDSGAPIRDEDGRIMGVVLVFRDITERRRAEEALRKAHDELELRVQERTRELEVANRALQEAHKYAESIVETLRESLLVLDAGLRVLTANLTFYKTFKVSPEETRGRFIYDLGNRQWDIPGLRKLLEDIIPQNTFVQNFEVNHELQIIGKRTMQLNARRIYQEGIGTQMILLAIEDITERKLAEEQIKESLKEKDVLLKEIHHRVKNNLQVISSLLMLQEDLSTDEKITEMLKDSQNRISSMALIHERLYRSGNLSKVDLKDYVDDLVSGLFQSYGVSESRVALNINVENVSLGIDSAIPCGLVINELVSNSLKHAFLDDRNGEIKISLHLTDEDMIELMVGDNGIGIPKDMDIRKTQSLGLYLVTLLVENQLHGEIILNRERGTEFLIKFRGMK